MSASTDAATILGLESPLCAPRRERHDFGQAPLTGPPALPPPSQQVVYREGGVPKDYLSLKASCRQRYTALGLGRIECLMGPRCIELEQL